MNIILKMTFGLLTFINSATTTHQEKEKFKGQHLLSDCLELIPMSYSTKEKEPFLAAVNRINGEEIALVTVDGKSATYKFYYFEKSESIDGEIAYLVPSNEIYKDPRKVHAIFLKYSKKKHFFYNSDCFKEKLKANAELSSALKMM